MLPFFMRFLLFVFIWLVLVDATAQTATNEVRRLNGLSGSGRLIADYFFAPRRFISASFSTYHNANFFRDFTAIKQSVELSAESSFGKGYYYGGRFGFSRDFIGAIGYNPSAYIGHVGRIKQLELHLQGDVYFEHISGAISSELGFRGLAGLIYPVRLSDSWSIRPGASVSPQWYSILYREPLKNSNGSIPDSFDWSISCSAVYDDRFMISAQVGMNTIYRTITTSPRNTTETITPQLNVSIRYMLDEHGRIDKLLKFY